MRTINDERLSAARPLLFAAVLGLASIVSMPAAAAEQLVYTALAQPCRLLDTRVLQNGFGPLTAAHGNYKFGASTTDINSAGQNGNSAGCGIPTGATAISVSINQLDSSSGGNIRTWSTDAGTTGPSAGTAVYNPTVATPVAGQVVYNGASAVISLGATDQRFYLAVANGQLDMTINVFGYWQPIAWDVFATGNFAVALGHSTSASGDNAFAAGNGNEAEGNNSTAFGYSSAAGGENAFVAGFSGRATGSGSVALGYEASATGDNAIALGAAQASGLASVAIGFDADTNGKLGSLAFGDASGYLTQNDAANQFMARAIGGFKFFTATDATHGVFLAAGGGSWMSLSDRNAKTAVKPIDSRDVLDRVVAMPVATWQYKAQDQKYRHIGPMAQDFYSAFGLGESDKGIDTVDADGVALAAIQGLNAKLERENASLRTELDDLKAAVKSLQRDHAGIATPDVSP